MSLDVDALSAQLREIYPGRDWRNKCQQLVWNVVWLTGTPESDIHTYPSAADAYAASEIVSMDPDAAPEGASHYFQNPWPDKHVAVALGAGAAFMASNFVGGDGLGVVGVRDYIARAGNPYLGWSYNNGVNKITVNQDTPAVHVEERDDMFIFQITDWDNRCYLQTPFGHTYVGSPNAVAAWSAATGKAVAAVPFGQFFEFAKSVNQVVAESPVAKVSDVKAVSGDVIEEAQRRGLIK